MVAKGVPVDSHGSVGPEVRSSSQVTLTTCPFCSSGCGLLIHTRNDQLVGVSPTERHPLSEGRLCARGWSAHEAPLWGERILHPCIKTRSGQRIAGWDEAMAEAASQIRALILAGKRVGVLGSGRATNEEAFLAVRLARDALETSHLDSGLRSSYQATLSGIRPEGGTLDLSGIWEFMDGSDLIVLVEDDLSESHPRIASLVMRARRRGALLLTMGPVRTQMSTLASSSLFLDPAGPPGSLRGLEDELGSLPNVSTATVIIAPYTSDTTRLRFTVGDVCCQVETWAAGLGAGVRFLPLPSLANSRGAFEMGLAPGFLPGVRYLHDQEARARIRAAWSPGARLEAGLGGERMVGEVAGLILLREDPLENHSLPDPTRRALDSLESLIVLDAFRTPASRRATVVLPVGAFSETGGTLISLDGRIQRWRPAHAPPGEAREGWRVLVDLIRALGVHSPYQTLGDVTMEIGRVVPELGGGILEDQGEPWSQILGEIRIPRDEAARLPGELVGPDQWDPERGEGNGSTFRLAVAGVHEWGEDPGVAYSPTLRREWASVRKLNPRGRLSISRIDADRLGLREGWVVRVRSQIGEVEVPLTVSPDVEPGLLLAPFGFRDRFCDVLGGEAAGFVTLERS